MATDRPCPNCAMPVALDAVVCANCGRQLQASSVTEQPATWPPTPTPAAVAPEAQSKFFRRDVLLSQEYLGFLLLNLADLFLTGWLFRHHFDEGNGVAKFILTNWGLTGFVIFKFILVLVVVLACEGISIQSIRKSKIIITAGCIVYAALVFYECYLIWQHVDVPQLQQLQRDSSISTFHHQPAPSFPPWIRA